MHDHPINSSEEDTLGVERFAQNLAQKILTSKTLISSTAIGIVAQWGYGKSSILNLMKEELRKENDKTLLFFDFNPWIYSKRSNLTSEFINTLENKVSPMREEWEETTKAITKYREALMPVLTLLDKAIAPIITASVPFGGTVWDALKNILKMNLNPTNEKNLEDCKDAINQSLEGKKVIVFIDDIDRLPTDEVMDILRMVKSICNFTNCVYVLAYDEEYVIKAIQKNFDNQFDKEKAEEKAEEYLEKIVSFPYKLPKHSYKTLSTFLKAGLKGIVEPNHYEQLVETEHCKALLEKLVPLYLQTPRKIKRLLNAFNTSYTIAGTNLHWGDLLAIEAIKLDNQETYKVISQNRDLYLKTIENQMAYEINKRNHSNTDTSVEDKRASLVPDHKNRALVDILLPQFGRRTPDDAYLERRVSHYSFFDNYFHIEPNNTVLSEKEIQELISVLDESPERFSEQLTIYIGENNTLFTSTLDTLIRRVQKMNNASKKALKNWFFTSVDDYTQKKQNHDNYHFFIKLKEWLGELLNPSSDSVRGSFSETFETENSQFYEWLSRIQNIETLTRFIDRVLDKDFNNFLDKIELSKEQINHLKILAIKQFKALIQDETHFESASIPYFFLDVTKKWEHSTNEEPYTRQWLEKAKQYPRVLSQFVYGFHRSSWGSNDNWIEPRPQNFLNWGIDREEAIEFLPKVIEYCKNSDPEKVPFMELFLKELKESTNNESP
jgi:predicted KAP-like P-loop ATPase